MKRATLVLVSLCALCGPAAGQDKTLNEGRPLSRLGDAFPIAVGDGAVLAGVAATFPRENTPSRASMPIAFLYGPFPRTQIGIGTTLSSDPRHEEDPHAGDVTGSVRVNFGRETVVLPSFATAVSVTIPSGVGAKGAVYEVKGYATKTLAFSLYGHLNVALDVADRVAPGERRARYSLALGANYPIPEWAALVVAADVFSDQSKTVGQPNTTGIEAGVRYRLTSNLYWDAGAGSELAGPRDRAVFFVTTGFTYGFTLGGR